MSTVLTDRRPVRRPVRRPAQRPAAFALAVLLCLLAACGSRLDPEEVAAAQGTGGAGGAGGTVPGAAVDTDGDGDLDTTDTPTGVVGGPTGTGTGTGTDTGAGADPGTGPGTDVPGAADPSAGPDQGGGEGDDAPGAPGDVPEENTADGGVSRGSCAGFTNQVGVTDTTITLANASDITGPVPGLFAAARQGTQAFLAYYNATEKLCGRSLELLALDSKADASADQQAYAQACKDSFAAVGSVSSFDLGGARTAEDCGLPDIRSFTVTPQRQSCSTCFSAYSIKSDVVPSAIPQYWLKKEPEASQHVGMFYVNVEAARTNALAFAEAYEKAGMNVDLVQGIETAEFSYAPFVQAMQQKGIRFVQYFGPYQFAVKLQQAMQQQGFKPTVYFEDATIYDAGYVAQANGVGEDSYVYLSNDLFESDSQEMRLYRSYLERVAPGAAPNWYGLYAWSATRLFVEQATALGGRLSRASLVEAMRRVEGWTSNDLHTGMAVGTGTTSPCTRIIQLEGSSWSQVSPGTYLCGGLIDVG